LWIKLLVNFLQLMEEHCSVALWIEYNTTSTSFEHLANLQYWNGHAQPSTKEVCVCVCISLTYYYQGPVQGLTKHIAARLTSKDVKNIKKYRPTAHFVTHEKSWGFLICLKSCLHVLVMTKKNKDDLKTSNITIYSTISLIPFCTLFVIYNKIPNH
jgi:hypothetical protein